MNPSTNQELDNRKSLERKIYITYKARINTAERLKANENFVQFLNIYYSLCLAAFSIYSINNKSYRLSLILVIASVMVTVVTVFLNTKKYSQRSKDLKSNYIALGELYQGIHGEENFDSCKFAGYSKKYANLLNSSENHSEFDYYRAVLNMKDEKIEFSRKFTFYLYRISRISVYVFFFILPLLLKYFAVAIEWIISV